MTIHHSARAGIFAAALVTGIASAPTQATILTFDLVQGGTSFLPAGYGDNVASSPQGDIPYLEGDGFTPDVTVDFLSLSVSTPHTRWTTGYGLNTGPGGSSMINVLGHGNYDVRREIGFMPTSGTPVVLKSFELGSFTNGSHATDVRIWDALGSFAAPNLLAWTGTIGPGVLARPLAQAVVGSGALHLYISNLGSTGIDNIHFTQTIPEPST